MKRGFKIISGGQSGVDRAALEWAVANDIPHGGWCPKGRKAEDGAIPSHFHLRETASDNYAIRTRRNVRDSGGTVIFSRNENVAGGTLETIEFAKEVRKPLLHLTSSMDIDQAAAQLSAFLREHGIVVLNVAGPRASEESGNSEFVRLVLSRALKPSK